MVPEEIIDIFPKGIVNIHPSLLPLHRGPIPVESVILDGSAKTGVSLMQLVKAMDAGPVYAQDEVELSGQETKQALTDRLLLKGRDMLIKHLPSILSGELAPKPQNDSEATYDQLITKDDGLLDWNKSAHELERQIRAYAGWPRSRAKLGQVDVIITAAHAVPSQGPDDPTGHIEIVPEAGVVMVTTSNGTLCLDRVIPVGKKEMPMRAFLSGYANRLS
jgi:methionyl-tRNA formyltransferase